VSGGELVRRPIIPDLGRILLLELVFGGCFVLVVDFALGWPFVLENWFAWPLAVGISTPLELFWGFPTVTARAVGGSNVGFELVRLRSSEHYPWSSLELVPSSRWHPLYGRGYVAMVVRPNNPVRVTLWLTRIQHEFLRTHQLLPR
jgi:hypothetical protein